MRGRWGTRRGTWLCRIRHLNNRYNSASMNTTRFFLTPTVFSWLIIFCKKQQKEAVRWFWRTRAICRPRFCYRFIKTVVNPLVSTTGSVSCWTKLKYCSNWCLEVLWYSDTMYMLFEKIKLIGFMRIKSMEKCAQRIRRYLKISQKVGSKRWSLQSFLKISAGIWEILFSLICIAIFTIFPVENRVFFYL